MSNSSIKEAVVVLPLTSLIGDFRLFDKENKEPQDNASSNWFIWGCNWILQLISHQMERLSCYQNHYDCEYKKQ